MPARTPSPATRPPTDAAVTPDEVTTYLIEVMRDEDADARLRLRAAELLGRHLGLFRDRAEVVLRDLAEDLEAARARIGAQQDDAGPARKGARRQ